MTGVVEVIPPPPANADNFRPHCVATTQPHWFDELAWEAATTAVALDPKCKVTRLVQRPLSLLGQEGRVMVYVRNIENMTAFSFFRSCRVLLFTCLFSIV